MYSEKIFIFALHPGAAKPTSTWYGPGLFFCSRFRSDVTSVTSLFGLVHCSITFFRVLVWNHLTLYHVSELPESSWLGDARSEITFAQMWRSETVPGLLSACRKNIILLLKLLCSIELVSA